MDHGNTFLLMATQLLMQPMQSVDATQDNSTDEVDVCGLCCQKHTTMLRGECRTIMQNLLTLYLRGQNCFSSTMNVTFLVQLEVACLVLSYVPYRDVFWVHFAGRVAIFWSD